MAEARKLLELADRVEKLAGPDREVDGLIYIALYIPAERAGRIDHINGCVGWSPKDAPYVSAIDVPRYTASLDAAMTLYVSAPDRIPACPRAACVEGLRQRACA